MSEILQIHIGQTGIQTGREVWDLLSQENLIEKDGKQQEQIDFQQKNESLIHQFFHELPTNKIVPRCIFMDLEPTCIDKIKMGESRALFNPNNFLNCNEDGITYARGHYTVGDQIIIEAIELIRKQVEKCCSFQGFVINHSICGGTGSGFTTKLINWVSKDYRKKLITTFSLFPSMYSNEIIENYNAALSLQTLIYNSQLTVCFDNHALYNTLQLEDQIDFIQYKDINRLIAQMQSTFMQTQNMNQIVQNLVPFPYMNFTYGTSQPTYLGSELGWKLDKLVKQSFLNNNQFLSVKKPEKMLSCAVLGRGDISPMDLVNKVHDVKDTLKIIDWIPNNLKIYQNFQKSMLIQDYESKQIKQSLSILQNNSGILDSLRLIHYRNSQVYPKRAFCHSYVRDMGEGLFYESNVQLERLISDYEKVESDVIMDDEEFDNLE